MLCFGILNRRGKAIPEQNWLSKDVMLVPNNHLFEEFIQKANSAAFETCDKAEFSIHTGKRYRLSVMLVLSGGCDKDPLYVPEAVKKNN